MTVRETYLKQMVESSNQEGLLMLLLDGGVNFIRRAIFAFEKDQYDDVNTYLVKAQNIYFELVLTLDLDAGEFAENLAQVYQFLYNHLIEANINKDIERIKSGLRLAEDIRDLWVETIRKAKEENGKADSVPGIAPESVAPKTLIKTGVYEPDSGAKLVEAKRSADDIPPSLNITG